MHRSILFLLLTLAGAAAAEEKLPVPTVVFVEDFENFHRARWHDFGRTPATVEVVDEGYRGKGVCITSTLHENTGGHLYRQLDEGLETCHLRFYVKLEEAHEYIHHFVHLVGYNPPTRWPQGGAGTRPEGHERFTTGIEPWGNWGRHRAPGAWNFYSYWCEMKGSRDGKFWGNSFAPEEPALVETDVWTCVEIMLRCNTVGEADGAQALWIDGKEIGRWEGIRWRKDEALSVNGLWMLYYITEQAGRHNQVKEPRKVNRVWFDEIVVSREYIGPLEDEEPEWRKLWDGESLEGWKALPGGSWTVEEEVLVGRSTAAEKRHGQLITTDRFGDFDLRVEFQALEGNSGLYFRVDEVKHAVAVAGFQAEVDPERKTGGLYETLGRAWVVAPKPADLKQWFKRGEWNQMEVSCHGRDVIVKLNGHVTAHLENDPGRIQGHIALQLHGGQDMHVRYRNLEIRGEALAPAEDE